MTKRCAIECSAETQLDLHSLSAHTLLEDDYFATVPMSAVRPVSTEKLAIEEEMHTSFEEAISGRVAAVSRQLSHLPASATSGCLPALEDGALRVRFPGLALRVRNLWRAWRRNIALLCLGLNLLLLGFDCMGLLVLAR